MTVLKNHGTMKVLKECVWRTVLKESWNNESAQILCLNDSALESCEEITVLKML